MMERRVRGNPHARCGAGEKVEMTSKLYLLLSYAKRQYMIALKHVSPNTDSVQVQPHRSFKWWEAVNQQLNFPQRYLDIDHQID
ncbi:hypothetical protein [Desulfosporosinus shakirovi]|uniref:hypothetical protein n=1 Tax=Desulfosporosinus shakirovi TaxID=2885154 RepID=UPI001E52CB0B|nr:hypothetical protein [Desulfosporosinus sp. SRJS8]MCB8818344.1 hypothetical protein [Desulfosporosinus sp. SRJS8]